MKRVSITFVDKSHVTGNVKSIKFKGVEIETSKDGLMKLFSQDSGKVEMNFEHMGLIYDVSKVLGFTV